MVDRAQVDAMANVLRKLEGNAGSAAQEIVAESRHNPDLGFAVEAERTETCVTVSRYDIRTEKKTVSESLKKTFYHIVDNKTGEMVADNLGLFESAMGIVKHLLYTKKSNAVDEIVSLDAAYVGSMIEAYSYKKRMQRLDESTAQYDVAAAKYSQTRQKLSVAKMKILKAL